MAEDTTTPVSETKEIQWKVSKVGQFIVGRCSEVLPGYSAPIEDVSDSNLPSGPEGVGADFVYNRNISFVIQGAFELTGESLPEPVVLTVGELLTKWRYPTAHTLTALAPINSYVCLAPFYPDDHSIWERSLIHISAGVDTTFTAPDASEMYFFVAKGDVVDQYGNEMTTNGLYVVDPGKEYKLSSYMNSYIIFLSK